MPGQTVSQGPRDVRSSGGGANGNVPKLKAKRQKAPLWAKAVTAVGTFMAVLAITGIVSVKYFLGQLTHNIQTTSSVLDDETAGTKTASGKLPDGAMNLLLLGLDTRAGWEERGEASRSDTMLILHIPATRDQAYMISIPRDMDVQIPADRTLGTPAQVGKINGAYATGSENKRGWTGGAKLATKTVHELTGIDFNGVVVIDFNGFQGMLNAMGGVYMCVDKDVWSSHYIIVDGKVQYAVGADPLSPPKNALWFKKGCREMKPWEALEFSRIRHSSNGDYDRQRHQQQLLRAMAKKATSAGILTNPARVAAILKAAGSSLKMDTHGVSVEDFMFGLKGLAAGDLIPVKTNNGTYAKSELGNGEGITQSTKDLFKATADDNLRNYLGRHPELLISDGAAS
ncbi:LCP family protein [Actinoplanes sp. CA-030573]|uniref:LCP family protein n=1 Tax=Actinoplanes sp. CA-030573 TaxID=3239898 RepID=UPI003D913376